MFDIGFMELLVIGVVALIVVGPKDLPGLFRTMGEFTGKARGMAREFNRAMQQAADESGVGDIQKTIHAAANPKQFGLDKVREATNTAFKPGPETEKLSKERQEAKDKISANAAKFAEERKAREAAETAQPDTAKDDT